VSNLWALTGVCARADNQARPALSQRHSVSGIQSAASCPGNSNRLITNDSRPSGQAADSTCHISTTSNQPDQAQTSHRPPITTSSGSSGSGAPADGVTDLAGGAAGPAGVLVGRWNR